MRNDASGLDQLGLGEPLAATLGKRFAAGIAPALAAFAESSLVQTNMTSDAIKKCPEAPLASATPTGHLTNLAVLSARANGPGSEPEMLVGLHSVMQCQRGFYTVMMGVQKVLSQPPTLLNPIPLLSSNMPAWAIPLYEDCSSATPRSQEKRLPRAPQPQNEPEHRRWKRALLLE